MSVTFTPTVPYAEEFFPGWWIISGVITFAGHTAAQSLDLSRYMAKIKHVSIDNAGGYLYWYDIDNEQIHVYDGIATEENDGSFAQTPTAIVIGRQS